MRTILCVLCAVTHGGIAVAQDLPDDDHGRRAISNFDTCVNEARQNHTERVKENFYSYECRGITAEKLAARPDQCGNDVKPALSAVKNLMEPDEAGLVLTTKWRTTRCAGRCLTTLYADSRETTHTCELRKLIGVDDGGPVAPEPDPGSR